VLERVVRRIYSAVCCISSVILPAQRSVINCCSHSSCPSYAVSPGLSCSAVRSLVYGCVTDWRRTHARTVSRSSIFCARSSQKWSAPSISTACHVLFPLPSATISSSPAHFLSFSTAENWSLSPKTARTRSVPRLIVSR
jgi:hypothetical protein